MMVYIPPKPAIWLPLDEREGTIAYDKSDNNRDGTLTGAQWSQYHRGMLPGSGCVCWHQFDEGQGDKLFDFSGYGSNGTIYGATWKQLDLGTWVLEFDGVDDRAEFELRRGLPTTEEISIIFWLKPLNTAEIPTWNSFYRLWVDANNRIDLQIDIADRFAPFLRAAGATYPGPRVAVDDKKWQQIAVVASTREGGFVQTFKNGTLIGTNINGWPGFAGVLRGRIPYHYSAIRLIVGEFLIYNRALSPTALERLYAYDAQRGKFREE